MDDERRPARVMTWNIHGAVGCDRRCDLQRVITLVQRHDPDIVALQEVDSRRIGPDATRAFELLASSLGQHAAEARVISARDGDYGHVIISRWPLSDIQLHDISVSGREPRNAIEATIATPHGPLHAVAAHLGLSFSERRRQSTLLARLARSGAERGMVLGDFNDWIWRGSVQTALAESMPARTHHLTFPALLPLLALDRIYCRPSGMLVRSWTDRSAWRASDHLPVVADLDLAAATVSGR